MNVSEMLLELLDRYPQEFERDSKASNPYFKDLKRRIQQTLQPIIAEFDLTLKALGGQGVMCKVPYINFLAEGHRTSKGIYPNYHVNIEQQIVYLSIGDADDNGPSAELVRKFAARARELLPEFQPKEHDGYPRKTYAKAELDNETLLQDLRAVCETHQLCLDEFAEEVQDYLQGQRVTSPDQPAVIWVIQASSQGELWNDWLHQEYISIGWSRLGEPANLRSLDGIREVLLQAYPTERQSTSPRMIHINNAHSVHNFLNVMKMNDLVAVIKGRHTLLGIGRVVGECSYHAGPEFENSDRTYQRPVQWLKTDEANIERSFPVKTLTPLYPHYVNYRKILEYWQGQKEDTTDTLRIDGSSRMKMTSAQILALINRFLKWYEQNGEQRREHDPEYARFSEHYFSSLSDAELIEVMFKFAYDGGKIQSGGPRTAGMFRESITSRITEFRQKILAIFSPEFNLEQWWRDVDTFKGFGKGLRSIFLHRVLPEKFTIFNNKSQEAYQLLG